MRTGQRKPVEDAVDAREREGVQLGESPDERGQVCDGRQLSMTLEITQCFRA